MKKQQKSKLPLAGVSLMEISKEQQEEFKARQVRRVIPLAEVRHFKSNGPKLTHKQYLAFLKSTDEKCK